MAVTAVVLSYALANPWVATAAATVGLLLALSLYLLVSPYHRKINNLGGPTGYPILGHAYLGLLSHKERVDFFLTETTKFHECFRVWLGPFFPTIAIYHPTLATALFKSTTNITKGISYLFLHEWLGTGNKWKGRRHLITPSFHFDVLKGFVETFREQTTILVRLLSQHADSGKTIDIFPIVTRCALDAICESAMGHPVHAQTDPENAYVAAVLDMSKQTFNRMLSPWLWNDFIYKTFFPSGHQYARDLQILHGFTARVIEKRRKQIEQDGVEAFSRSENGTVRSAFLDMLLTAMDDEGNKLTDSDIREEVETFMFEGHDTTATAIAWALYNLASAPQYQRRVQEELDNIMGSRTIPTYDDLNELDFLECCIKESLRLYPSVPIIARTLDEDMVVEDKIFPKGTQVAVVIIAMHRRPDIWGEDAQEFNPDRFHGKGFTGTEAFSYVPFSAGSRNCIGQRFAQYEEKTILAGILKNYDVELDQSFPPPELCAELILRPGNGVNVKLRKRH